MARKLIPTVCYGDLLVGLLTAATITTAIVTAVQGSRLWSRTDTVAVELAGLSVALFIRWRRVAPQGNVWLCGSVAVGAGATLALLFRQWPLVWPLGLAAVLLCGLILRAKLIAKPLAAHDLVPILLLVGSVLVTLALVEGTLRLAPSLLSPEARLQVYDRGAPAWYMPHPYIGHLNHLERHAHDPWGFRNQWPWPTPVDILAVGDSFTYGYLVADEEAWPLRLARALAPRTVINLGLIGAAPQQYLRLYEIFGLPLTPKVLLVGIFLGNDLWGAKEFEQWWHAGGLGAFPDFWRGERSAGLRGWIRRQWRELYLVALWQDVQDSYRTGRLFAGRSLALASGERLQLAPSLLARTAAGAQPGSAKFTLVLDTIVRIAALAQQHQTLCVILFFPSKEEVYLPLLDEHVPDLAQLFIAALEQRGIAVLNLGPYFRARAAAGEQLFFGVDGHPNAQGHALIAEVVGAYLSTHAPQLVLRGESSFR